MPLVKIADFSPNYKQEIFGGIDIKGFEVYSQQQKKIGSVSDILVDEGGRIRYLVIDTGFWVLGKKVLLPIGLMRMDFDQRRLVVQGLTKQQVESLPAYQDNIVLNYDYEEQVRKIYRPVAVKLGKPSAEFKASAYTSDTYSYEHEPALFALDEQNNKTLKLYEEHLMTHKNRYEAGEVTVGKRIETSTEQVEVPVAKERVVIERQSVSEPQEVEPGSVDFDEGEVARMTVHEESADIQKKAFLREEVGIRKEVERDTVKATEEVRREELDVQVEGEPVVKRKQNKKTKRS